MSESEAFDAFYRSSYDRTLRYLYGMLGDLPEAQDSAQEAYGRAWRHWREVGDLGNPEAWVRTVGWRVAANRLRHLRIAARWRHQQQESRDAGQPSVDNLTLLAALKRIRADQRQVLVLHYMLDLPVQQVADEAGISVSAAKARMVRGRAALSALLSEPEEASHVGRS